MKINQAFFSTKPFPCRPSLMNTMRDYVTLCMFFFYSSVIVTTKKEPRHKTNVDITHISINDFN